MLNNKSINDVVLRKAKQKLERLRQALTRRRFWFWSMYTM